MILPKDISKLLRRDSVRAILLKYTGIVFTFILQILMLKLSSTETYGIYIQLLAWSNILGTACAMGQMTYLTKNVSISLGVDQYMIALNQALTSIVIIVFVSVGLYIFAITIGFVVNIAGVDNPLNTGMQTALLFIVPMIAIQRAITGFSRGSGQAITELASNHLLKPILQLLFILAIAFVFAGVPLEPSELIGVLGASLACVIIFQLVALILKYRFLLSDVSGSIVQGYFGAEQGILSTVRTQTKKSLVFTGMNLVTVVEKSADVIIVGAVLDASAAGVYGFITRLYRISNTAQTSLNAVFASKAANQYAQNNVARFNKTIKTVTTINVINAAFFLVLFILAGKLILESTRPELAEGWVPLIILSVFAVIRSIAGPVSMTASMVGAEKAALKITVITLLLGIGLMYFLTINYGIVGTAIGAALMSVSRAWMLFHMLKKD